MYFIHISLVTMIEERFGDFISDIDKIEHVARYNKKTENYFSSPSYILAVTHLGTSPCLTESVGSNAQMRGCPHKVEGKIKNCEKLPSQI